MNPEDQLLDHALQFDVARKVGGQTGLLIDRSFCEPSACADRNPRSTPTVRDELC